MTLVGNSSEKFFDWSQAYLAIPYTVTLSCDVASAFGKQTTAYVSAAVPAVAAAVPENAFAVGVKGYHHFIDTTYIKYNGINVNRGTSYVNFMMNENLKKMGEDEYRKIGDIMNLNWDSPDSYKLNIASATAGVGIGEINNVPGDSVLSNVSYLPPSITGTPGATIPGASINALPLINGFNSSTFGNRGHLNRMLKTNMDLATANGNLGQIFAPGNISNWFQPSMTANTANALTWTGMATIPLNKLHDFFDKLPTV